MQHHKSGYTVYWESTKVLPRNSCATEKYEHQAALSTDIMWEVKAWSYSHKKHTTKDGSTVRYVGTVQCASILTTKYGTLVGYAFFVMVRVWYAFFEMVRERNVGALFELKIPDFSHIAPAFCMQRQKTAKADAKCVN